MYGSTLQLRITGGIPLISERTFSPTRVAALVLVSATWHVFETLSLLTLHLFFRWTSGHPCGSLRLTAVCLQIFIKQLRLAPLSPY